MNLFTCIYGFIVILIGISMFSAGIWGMSKDKWQGIRYTKMSDLPNGTYQENYSDDEITFEQNGKAWKTYKKITQ